VPLKKLTYTKLTDQLQVILEIDKARLRTQIKMDDKDSPNNFLKYSNLGLQMLLVIGAFGWIGLKIDQYLGLKFPVFLLTLILLSFIGIMYRLYRSLDP